MARFVRKSDITKGRAPGALLFVGTQRVDQVKIEAITYDPDQVEQRQDLKKMDIAQLSDQNGRQWINVVGIHDVSIIQAFGDHYELHPLLQEDILNTTQRPKFEEFPSALYIVVKLLHLDDESQEIQAEQLSLVVAPNLLLSFQEISEDVFDTIRQRLLKPTTKIRHRNSDYLAFALLDAIVDEYILIIERFGEKIEALEEELLSQTKAHHLGQINRYKKEINFLRKAIRPVRELVFQFRKCESELIDFQTLPYLSDLVDHINQASEDIELYRDMLNDQLSIYNSSISNKLNEIIQVLTIFSVVFIPLTFLAGIYGMNFKYLPELNYRYAYPIFWLVLLGIASGMIFYFKRKKWL